MSLQKNLEIMLNINLKYKRKTNQIVSPAIFLRAT